MKRMVQWMMAAILICGTSVFTACNVDNVDNPAVEPDLNVAEKIIGEWIVADQDGQPMMTNDKVVLNFVSTTKVYVSASINNNLEVGEVWVNLIENDVDIVGNKVIITGHPEEHTTVIEEFTVTEINANEFKAELKATVEVDGTIITSGLGSSFRFVRNTADYSTAILGMWEGRSTGAEGSEFDDGENHRWEFLADGTFRYYHKVEGLWQPSDDVFSDYFVDGPLLCSRWKNVGEGKKENREWWEIAIEDDVMKWTALRKKEDGTTYTATFEMKKVE